MQQRSVSAWNFHMKAVLFIICCRNFAYNDLNMTKIESRPMEGKSWEYRFFIDFEGNLADPAVKNAIRGLREESRNLRILGNYKRKHNVEVIRQRQNGYILEERR